MSREVRVRYAPSPTGYLHIGNTRTAMFNYMFARHHNGKFIIRIEDTDLKRNIEGGEESQFKYLKWLGMEWDEGIDAGGEYGPYRQTERLDIYKEYWKQLIDKGLAYYCYCTEEELEQEREEWTARGEFMPAWPGKHRHLTEEQRKAYEAEGRVASVRFLVQGGRSYTFQDMVRGDITFESEGISDFVIVKKDGIPTYNFAVAVDDHLMKISHVLRGEEHISNTPRQLMIFEAFGWAPPTFGHMSLIVNEKRKKLSKRDHSVVQFIEQYDQLGYLPEAMFNFIALLGWSPESEDELMDKEELFRLFDANRLSRSPAVFDVGKLKYVNNHYIKKADISRIVHLAIPYLQKVGRLGTELDEQEKEWVTTLVALYQEQLNCVSEIVELTTIFFRDKPEYNDEANALLQGEHVPVVLKSFLQQVQQAGTFTTGAIGSMFKAVQKETGYKGKQLFMPVRVALTGQMHGRDLDITVYLLGKQKVAQFLQNLL